MRRAIVISILALTACQAGDGRAGEEGRSGAVLTNGFGETTEEAPAAQIADSNGSPPPIVCRADGGARPLPQELRETSGLARGRQNPAVFWTHNDAGNPPDLFLLDADGNLTGSVRLDDATSTDWEDIESGPCPEGDCLFIADVGDNDGERESITIYRIPEPGQPSERVTPVAALQASFPDGSWDAEALFALPNGSLYVVTKGRSGPITLYQAPVEGAETEVVTMRRIRDLLPAPANGLDRVTAATATPDGRWVALRTYRALLFYPASELVAGEPIAPTVVDLSELGHPQGEAVAMADDGTVWLTSESENDDAPALWSRLRCELPDAGSAN